MTITDPTVVNDGAPSKPRSAIAVVPFDPARDAEAFCRARVLAFDDTAISQAMWPEPRPSVEDRIRERDPDVDRDGGRMRFDG
jgi:hypothetical protein